MSIQLIKQAIKTKLDSLVTDGVLGGATTTDIKKDPLSADIPSYPHAFLMPPSFESETLDNRSNLRTYTFDIVVILNAENITGTEEVEILMEAIADEFENDPTLNGKASGGMPPIASAPAPYQHAGKDLIMFVIQIQAKADVTLTFA